MNSSLTKSGESCPKCGKPLLTWTNTQFRIKQLIQAPKNASLVFLCDDGSLYFAPCEYYGVCERRSSEIRGHAGMSSTCLSTWSKREDDEGDDISWASAVVVVPMMDDREMCDNILVPACEMSNYLGVFFPKDGNAKVFFKREIEEIEKQKRHQ